MKLQTKDYLALEFLASQDRANLRERFRAYMMTGQADVLPGYRHVGFQDLLDPDARAERVHFIDTILADAPFKHYLLTDTAQEIALKVKVGDSFNFGLLNTLRPQHSCYITGPDEFIRFIVEPGQMRLMLLQRTPVDGRADAHMVYFDTFTIDFVHGVLGAKEMHEKQNAIARRLLQLVIFVEMSEPELLLLKPGRKPSGLQILKGDTYRNETPVAITRVHSNWNKFVVRTEAFGVQGHLRLQACGERHTQRKLTWVSAHTRKGYTRAARH